MLPLMIIIFCWWLIYVFKVRYYNGFIKWLFIVHCFFTPECRVGVMSCLMLNYSSAASKSVNYQNTAGNAVTAHINFVSHSPPPVSNLPRLIELLQWAMPFFISEDLQDWILISCCSFCVIIKLENALQLNHADVERYTLQIYLECFYLLLTPSQKQVAEFKWNSNINCFWSVSLQSQMF